MTGAVEALSQAGGLQVVMVRIGSETFALDAGMVREIIDPIPATRVAGARAHLDRIVNVRGNVVPLADIRERFGMRPEAATQDTRFVVIEVEIEGDAPAEHRLGPPAVIAQQPVEVDRPRLRPVPAREGQEVAGERRGALGGVGWLVRVHFDPLLWFPWTGAGALPPVAVRIRTVCTTVSGWWRLRST